LTGLAGGPLAAPAVVSAEGTYPNRPVRYANPYPAGGPTDTLSRLFCAKMTELTGQQWIVENRGSAGGNVGMDALTKSESAGDSLGLGGIAAHAIAPALHAKLPFNARSDFTFVSVKRTAVAPKIPTIAETLPGFDIVSWTTLCGPAKLPPDVTAHLSEFSRKALEGDDVKAKFADLGSTAWWRTPANTLAYRDSEEARLAPLSARRARV
jgi:tripartite-type tricarboxylate transporter receptor subunit TctC